MPLNLRDLASLNRLRLEADRLERERLQALTHAETLRVELEVATRTGADIGERAALETRIERAGRTADTLRDRVEAAGRRVEEILARDRERVETVPAPTLRADTPTLMLPVRLETRYVNGDSELRVRLFPDAVHIDNHETALTTDEVAAGRFYWNERWGAASAVQERELGRAAFGELARRFRPRRAAWIVHAMQPLNLAPAPRNGAPQFPQPALRPRSWSRAAFATALPTHWVVVGYAEDAQGRLQPWFRKTIEAVVPEQLATGPDPLSTATPAVDAEGVATELPLDPGMAWLASFDEAERVGMAVRIVGADLDRNAFPAATLAATPIKRLVAYGYSPGLSGAAGAARFGSLLRAHRYADGLELLRPGTPTNNLEQEAAGFTSGEREQVDAADPMAERPPAAPALDRLAGALALDRAASHLHAVAGQDGAEAETTADMVDALWNATLGQTLDQLLDPQLDDAAIAQARGYARQWLRPGGALPAVRIGRQPYGVLPVVARRGYQAADGIERHVLRVLEAVREVWRGASTRAPRLARPGAAPDEMMEQLLQHAPLPVATRFRRVLGPLVASNSQASADLAAAQERVRHEVLPAAGVTPSARIASMTLEPRSQRLGAPFVQPGKLDGDARLAPNYLAALAVAGRGAQAREALDKAAHDGASLLEVLAAHAALYEHDRSVSHVVQKVQLERGLISQLPARVALRVNEMPGIAETPLPAPAPNSPPPLAIHGTRVQAELKLVERTGVRTVSEHVIAQIADANGRDRDAVQPYEATLQALARLADRPAAELDRVLRGLLDAYGNRLDAWYASLAHKRLAHWRAQPGSQGLLIGGYGWVEDLSPQPRPASEGYVHAPSLHHAQTAAVLRSGHVAHRGEAGKAMDIDLSSRRVRLALGLLDGVAQGQPLAALLGYRMERGLRDRNLRLARHILPLRRLFPLRPPEGQTVLGQAEAIAARDVVDGVQLLDRRRQGADWLAGLNPAADAADRAEIEAVAAEVADLFDATSDLLLAEGVHQLVGGNVERAASALSAMDRQTRPIEPEVVQTPRGGRSFAQRAGVLFTTTKPAPGWDAVAPDLRALTEPVADVWLTWLLGPLDRIGFGAHVQVGPDAAGRRELDAIAAGKLGLSALSLLMLSEPGSRDRPSELQALLAARFADQVGPDLQGPQTELHLHAEAPEGFAIGLAALEALLERARTVLSRHRAAHGRDFVPPGIAAASGVDGQAVADRAKPVFEAFAKSAARLDDALAAPAPDLASVRAALDQAAQAGVLGAVVGVVDEEAPTPVFDQARQLASRLATARARIKALDDAFVPPVGDADAAALALAAHHTERIRLMLGGGFPVLPPFTLAKAAASELRATLESQDELLGATPGSRLAGVVGRMAEVRPRLADLSHLAASAEIAAGAAVEWRVAQLPHTPGAPWVGLPHDAATAPVVDASLVLHTPQWDADALRGPVAALMSDDWTEVIPAATETTAVAFHFDAPGARAPQAWLLAVHPDASARAWQPAQLLDAVNEALDLAHLRAVRPQDLDVLGALLPLVVLPHNFGRALPAVDFGNLYLKAQSFIDPALRTVLGKA